MGDFFSGQTAGFALANLAFVSALAAAFSFFKNIDGADSRWNRLGLGAFVLHAFSAWGIVILLLGFIIAQQYQFHYVYTHASNELPLHFVVSCLWEGQEGSFLLWMCWHSLLGLIAWRWTPPEWRAGVVGTVASIEAILSSMVLGAYLRDWTVFLLYMTAAAAPAAALVVRAFRASDNALKSLGVLAFFSWLFISVNLWKGQTGFLPNDILKIPFLLEIIAVLALVGGAFWLYSRKRTNFVTPASAIFLGVIAIIAFFQSIESWKIGSSPFLLLRQTRPDLPVFQMDPNFVPLNGNGLNPLLQNYWMAIHPPTLFLGFASATLPFGFVLTALIRRKYADWLKPAAPWALFSVMILGVGIIMGGYWAYETLNFGGYWNWDPVENASLVPWITGVGALHAMLSYRKGKTGLTMAMLLVCSTFILVLYSTFLTRSGVLGEASVHSFTDLGLSGQLLVLLMVYLLGVGMLFWDRWKEIPADKKEVSSNSREFYLFLAALTLAFVAIEISLVTSLPVFNKIFGTRLAPPAKLQFFYYQWNVWFGVIIAALSAIGQYFYWTKIEKETLLRNLFRPFAAAAVGALAIMGALFYAKWQFVYNQTYIEALEAAEKSGSTLKLIAAYMGYGVLFVADELLLLAGLFTIFANGFILFRLAKRNHFRHWGGSLAHIGFGLMLVGILFSSGYESTVSVNFTPSELSNAFPEEAKKDNVLLVRETPKFVKDYKITYKGRVRAQGPISNLKVVQDDALLPKLSFQDKNDNVYALEFPSRYFLKKGASPFSGAADKPVSPENRYDFSRLKYFIEEQLPILKPSMLNERSLFEIEFVSLADSNRRFTLFPEAEQTDNTGMISHPDRKIYPQTDVYAHVSSIPENEKDQWEIVLPNSAVGIGDTVKLPEGRLLVVEGVKAAKENEIFPGSDLTARLQLKILDGAKYYLTSPAFMIDQKQNRLLPIESYVEALSLRFAFLSAQPEENKVTIQVLQNAARPDYITLKAVTKPYINFLWLGTFVMTAGFLVAIFRKREA